RPDIPRPVGHAQRHVALVHACLDDPAVHVGDPGIDIPVGCNRSGQLELDAVDTTLAVQLGDAGDGVLDTLVDLLRAEYRGAQLQPPGDHQVRADLVVAVFLRIEVLVDGVQVGLRRSRVDAQLARRI